MNQEVGTLRPPLSEKFNACIHIKKIRFRNPHMQKHSGSFTFEKDDARWSRNAHTRVSDFSQGILGSMFLTAISILLTKAFSHSGNILIGRFSMLYARLEVCHPLSKYLPVRCSPRLPVQVPSRTLLGCKSPTLLMPKDFPTLPPRNRRISEVVSYAPSLLRTTFLLTSTYTWVTDFTEDTLRFADTHCVCVLLVNSLTHMACCTDAPRDPRIWATILQMYSQLEPGLNVHEQSDLAVVQHARSRGKKKKSGLERASSVLEYVKCLNTRFVGAHYRQFERIKFLNSK